MSKFWLVVLSLAAVSLSWSETSAREAEILDFGEPSIEDVAAQVCKVTRGEDKQISKPETVIKLARKIIGGADRKCWNTYSDAFAILMRVLEFGNEDICGEKKMAAIEYYHRHFITSVSKHKKQRKAIPRIIKLFFMQYASYISSRCERNALKLLPEALELLDKEENKIDEVINSFAQGLGFQNVAQWDDVFLLWNLIENLPLEKDEKFARHVQAGWPKVFLAEKNPNNLVIIQSVCNYRLRPLYVNTILPVMRLVDMGYYPKSDELIKQISSNPSAKRLYLTAQFCETINPLAITRNEELAEGESRLIPIEEVKYHKTRLVAKMEEQKTVESSDNVLPLDDHLESIQPGDAKQTVRDIKSRIKSRGKVGKKALVKLAQAVKTLSQAKQQISITTKDGPMETLNESKAEQANTEVDPDLDDEADGSLARVRRGMTMDDFKTIVMTIVCLPFILVGAVIYLLVYILLEWPFQKAFKRRLIPTRETDLTGKRYWDFSLPKPEDDLYHREIKE